MKRIIAVVMTLFLILPGFAAAAAPWGEQAGSDNPGPGDQERVRAEENSTAGDRVQQRIAENATPRGEEGAPDRDRVRSAVHALLAAENRIGGIGADVSAVAREIENSVRATTPAEEQIRTRNHFIRFLLGGDKEAARMIGEEARQNLERTAELRRAIGNCTCDDEARTMLREQIRAIEWEQKRLETLAEEELQNRGLLSWG
ncbi:hypothetical protein F8E02_05710 [Methanoculleus sp. Wushi-C6]|uniref:DUF5667 domain-containing protein n=1 Tax=Methanoculleus caldifontis TaxID=2651577 RepID=A0ABU3X0D7_9EURY|nr:hypothetical protein [Methanoculleus sp. Wushi-C6]MDV2481509.1 hypothetical protein [Methanoculleus sp. Wushi-C6]